MPEFLAETYTPRLAPGTPTPSAADAARAAAQASGPQAPVRFLGAIIVPEEETCFWLYQAASADAVRAAMIASELRPDRITPAISIRPPDPTPGTATQTGHPRRHLTQKEPPGARRAPAHGSGDA
jgi:hypothetical protein